MVFELDHLMEEQQIILRHFPYYVEKLWNQVNYLYKKIIPFAYERHIMHHTNIPNFTFLYNMALL